jgi:hypothetical protein
MVDDITFILQGILSMATVVPPNDDFDGLVTDETSYRDDWRSSVTKRAVIYGNPRDDDDDDDDESGEASDVSTQPSPTTEGERRPNISWNENVRVRYFEQIDSKLFDQCYYRAEDIMKFQYEAYFEQIGHSN